MSVYVGAGLRCTGVDECARICVYVCVCVCVCRWTRRKSRPKGRPQAVTHSHGWVYTLSRSVAQRRALCLAMNIARHTARNCIQKRARPSGSQPRPTIGHNSIVPVYRTMCIGRIGLQHDDYECRWVSTHIIRSWIHTSLSVSIPPAYICQIAIGAKLGFYAHNFWVYFAHSISSSKIWSNG